MKKTHRIVCFILVLGVAHLTHPLANTLANASDSVQLLTFKTHSRLVLSLGEDSPTQVKNTPQGFEVLLKGITLNDLGAPLGEEENWKPRFQSLADLRVGNLEFKEVSEGLKVSGKWKFPTGKATLAHPEMEIFDFHQHTPEQYVLDFWVKEGPTVSEAEEEMHRQKSRNVFAQFKKSRELAAKRSLASVKKKTRDRFVRTCGEPIDDQNDLFLEFMPVHQKVDFSRWFSTVTADQNYEYKVPKEKTKEAQYVRLALNFLNQGKVALTIRTIDFLEEEFPETSFKTEMKFLRANSLLRLNLIDAGEKILKELAKEKTSSEISLRSSVFLSARLMENNSGSAALENFLWLAHHYPESKWTWIFHLGAAECFYSLKQTEQALKEYQWVIDHAPDRAGKSEGAYRLGDVFLQRRQYEQGLAAYFHASEYFKDESQKYPSYFLNRAESYYQLGKFEEARSTFQIFLKNFPTQSQGWRATFRLGEIAARMAHSDDDIETARLNYIETINRYPASPGVVLARVRLAPCGDHAGFTFDSQDRFFTEEAKKFDGQGEVYLTHFDDYRALGHVRTLITLGTLEQSLDGAIHELKQTHYPPLRKILTETANQLFAKLLLDLLAKGKKFEALSKYTEKAAQIPEPEEMTNKDYLLALSQAALDLGLGKFSTLFSAAYRQHQETKIKIEKKERDLASPPSKFGNFEETVKASEENFIEARSLWDLARTSKGEVDAEKVRHLLNQVQDESPFGYPKYLLLSLVDEKMGNLKSAIANAARAQLIGNSPRLESWLASLHARVGDSKSALSIYEGLKGKVEMQNAPKASEGIEASLGLSETPSLDSIALAQGAILEKEGRWGEAATTYSHALEKGGAGNELLYEYARSLMKVGNVAGKAKAEQALEKIVAREANTESDRFWKKMAEETLANEKQKESLEALSRFKGL